MVGEHRRPDLGNCRIYHLQSGALPILIVGAASNLRKEAAKLAESWFFKNGIIPCQCRGVNLDRLPDILRNGCDVYPTNSPMFMAADFGKAIEYGGDSQVIQIFDVKKTKRTWIEIDSNEDPAVIENLKETYTSWESSVNGNRIWFSMFPIDHPARTKAYEADYGWFIPGDAKEALIGLAIFAPRDTAAKLIEPFGSSDLPGIDENVATP
jgi:hypothetical protein